MISNVFGIYESQGKFEWGFVYVNLGFFKFVFYATIGVSYDLGGCSGRGGGGYGSEYDMLDVMVAERWREFWFGWL